MGKEKFGAAGKVVDQGGAVKFTVLGDNLAAKENVSRFSQHSGYEI